MTPRGARSSERDDPNRSVELRPAGRRRCCAGVFQRGSRRPRTHSPRPASAAVRRRWPDESRNTPCCPRRRSRGCSRHLAAGAAVNAPAVAMSSATDVDRISAMADELWRQRTALTADLASILASIDEATAVMPAWARPRPKFIRGDGTFSLIVVGLASVPASYGTEAGIFLSAW
jgi:hypothetical protein